jgi:hypothetical protein
MQGIYTYIPETNYVPREYSGAYIASFSVESIVLLLYYYFYYHHHNHFLYAGYLYLYS